MGMGFSTRWTTKPSTVNKSHSRLIEISGVSVYRDIVVDTVVSFCDGVNHFTDTAASVERLKVKILSVNNV